MPNNNTGLTPEQWNEMQTNNPEQWGGYQAISGDNWLLDDQGNPTAETSAYWGGGGGVQQVGSTLYGLAGEGEMPMVPAPPPIEPPTSPPDTTPPDTTAPPEDGEDGEPSQLEQDYQEYSDDLILEMEQITQNITDAGATLDEDYQEIIASIRARYEIRRQQMETLNRKTLAGHTKAGIRSGRQRYASEIQGGILSAQEAAGYARLAELGFQEDSSILEAKLAYNDKNFELLQMKSENIINIQKQKMQTILDLNDLAYQEEERMRSRMTFERQKGEWAKEDANTRLESMMTAGINLDALSDDEYTNLETDLGLMPDTLDDFYTGLQDAQEAQAVGDSIKLQKSIMDLLNSTPEGMEITIGDSTYTGLKDMVDRMSYTEIIGNTKYEVMVDKKTGEELWRKSAGQAYKPSTTSGSTGGSEFSAQEKRKLEQEFGSDWETSSSRQEQLDFLYEDDGGGITDVGRVSELTSFIEEQGLRGEDNMVSWETYLAMKQTWINNGGTVGEFNINFPIGTWLDEDNQDELDEQL